MPSQPAPAEYYRAAEQLGRRVRTLREAQHLTQEKLAEMSGLSRNQIQNIEGNRGNQKGANGQPTPGNARLDTVFRLANALGVDVVYLISPDSA